MLRLRDRAHLELFHDLAAGVGSRLRFLNDFCKHLVILFLLFDSIFDLPGSKGGLLYFVENPFI